MIFEIGFSFFINYYKIIIIVVFVRTPLFKLKIQAVIINIILIRDMYVVQRGAKVLFGLLHLLKFFASCYSDYRIPIDKAKLKLLTNVEY